MKALKIKMKEDEQKAKRGEEKAEEIEEVEDENAIIPKPMEPSQQPLSSFDELIKERKEAPLGPKMTTLKKKQIINK